MFFSISGCCVYNEGNEKEHINIIHNVRYFNFCVFEVVLKTTFVLDLVHDITFGGIDNAG